MSCVAKSAKMRWSKCTLLYLHRARERGNGKEKEKKNNKESL